ncbi:hypothetical protein ILUMI_02225 [Ignelater luminosus]|uniref:Gamma-glutamyltransferase n=1 Tax=Ignelater luminosus TaxID=2038154 RepID=A0A8K0DIQ3_IGNLU|nr:hypothetical protein ILUMI_02225 [Ignelater luminosus]
MGCCIINENDDNAYQRRWCVRIGLTSLVLFVIIGLVFASVFHRGTYKKFVKVSKDEDDNDDESIRYMTDEKSPENKSAAYDKSGLAILAEHPFCAETGGNILNKGGSAVDAAIAMLFCQGVVEPHHSGLGGGFVMTIYDKATRKVYSLDARGTAPSLATVTMFERYSKVSNDTFQEYSSKDQYRQEWLTVTIPSEGLGLWEAHKRYGKLKWNYLVDPAIRLASHGFPISPNLAKFLAIYNRTVKNSPQLRKVFVNPETNETYKEGDDVVNEELAKVLMRIASDGVDFIYKGTGARKMAEESLDHGGIFSRKDFTDYDIRWSTALSHGFQDQGDKRYTLHMPPPPSYAIMIGMMLNIVNGYERTDSNRDMYSPSRLAKFHHKIIEAMKHTFARKDLFGDSARTSPKILYKFLNSHWGSRIRNLISPTSTFPPNHYTSGKEPSASGDSGTTNVAAVDSEGNVVVASSSLNDPFGSGIVSETLGFLLNNNMLSFTMTNFSVPVGSDYGNIIHPGKRPSTFLSPVIVLDENENFKLAMAASGDTRIITSIALILMRYFWLDQTLADASAKFRFHHQLEPNVILYEGENKTYAFEYLRAYGHKLEYINTRWPHVNHMVVENGTLITFTDNRENI